MLIDSVFKNLDYITALAHYDQVSSEILEHGPLHMDAKRLLNLIRWCCFTLVSFILILVE